MPELPTANEPLGKRIDSLDALRGVAVLGIFAINILGYGLGEVAFYNPQLIGGDRWLDNALWTANQIFVEGSMRGLFTLLFGAGLVLFTDRAPYPDGPIRVADLHFRRTFWLLIIGLVHSYLLLGRGDILVIYAMAGVVLFPFRILSARALLALSAAILVLLTLDAIEFELGEEALRERAVTLQEFRDGGGELTTAERAEISEWYAIVKGNRPLPAELAADRYDYTGDAATIFAANAAYVNGSYGFLDTVGWLLDACMLMFAGMALYKTGLLRGAAGRATYWRLVLVGYAIGLPIRIWTLTVRWQADFSPDLVLWPMFASLAQVALTLGHVGAFMLLWHWLADSTVMRALAATGRMALSNYLGQTVIANLIFTGIGFGLYGTVSFTTLYAIVLAVWAAQIAVSVLWLRRYRFGPLEWLWRCLTYAQRFPLRRLPPRPGG